MLSQPIELQAVLEIRRGSLLASSRRPTVATTLHGTDVRSLEPTGKINVKGQSFDFFNDCRPVFLVPYDTCFCGYLRCCVIAKIVQR